MNVSQLTAHHVQQTTCRGLTPLLLLFLSILFFIHVYNFFFSSLLWLFYLFFFSSSIFANVPLHHRPSTVFCPAPNAIKLCSTTKHVVMNVVVVSSLYCQLAGTVSQCLAYAKAASINCCAICLHKNIRNFSSSLSRVRATKKEKEKRGSSYDV